MNKSKYVLLMGLQHGNKFFTFNHEDCTLLANGDVGYAIIGYADTVRDAQMQLYGYSTTELEE